MTWAPDSSSTVQQRVIEIQERIAHAAAKAGRQSEDVTLIAVTKTHPAAAVLAAMAAGVLDMGENRVQEAAGKIEEVQLASLAVAPRWHLIGHLQSNKAKQAISAGFALVHSVDSEDLARELQRRAEAADRRQDILFQVNVSGEDTKAGVDPDKLVRLVEFVVTHCPNLCASGLMTMAPLDCPGDAAKPVFASLRELRDAVRPKFQDASNASLQHLSMGMTNDFEAAIEEGATLVRIGSALFGAR